MQPAYIYTIWKPLMVRVHWQVSFPRFPFIVSVSSQAMHSGSVAATFEQQGVELPAPHLQNVEVLASLCESGASSSTCCLSKIHKNLLKLTTVDLK